MNRLQPNHPRLKAIRAQLRRQSTAPEIRLWQRLRQEQLGVKFRRQHSLGTYVVDFYAPAIRLVIEVDGDSHFDFERARVRDAMRDAALSADRILVLRFTIRANESFELVKVHSFF
ncbi:MAG: DUF559 domain-containing protein [bacterium]|nr:DUF559 domain-containing protein [bacterium]